MADAVSSTTIEDGAREVIVQLTNLSDGTGEAKVTKIDVSSLAANNLSKSCDEVRIQEIWAQVHGFDGVQLWFDASTDVVAFNAGVGWTYQDFSSMGGLKMYGQALPAIFYCLLWGPLLLVMLIKSSYGRLSITSRSLRCLETPHLFGT